MSFFVSREQLSPSNSYKTDNIICKVKQEYYIHEIKLQLPSEMTIWITAADGTAMATGSELLTAIVKERKNCLATIKRMM